VIILGEASSGTTTDLVGGLLSAPRWRLAVKRGVDVFGSLLGLVLLAPVFVVASLAVLATSGPPVLYTQMRVGRFGRSFRIIKIRTMRRDADSQMGPYQLRNELDGPIFKIRDDPRTTRIGRILRRFSVDELPQLVNVLIGQMSLVGPRPLLPEEHAELDEQARLRCLATPGLTGIWQVSGRCDVDFHTWIDMDLEYIRTWNLRRDVGVLVRTIPAVITGRGSY